VIDPDLLAHVGTPSYVIDEEALEENLGVLARVEREAGCRILLAQKAFSCYDFYPLIGRCLSGTAASGIYEARLGRTYFSDGEVHVFSPSFRTEEFEDVLTVADHVVFNSFSEWARFRERLFEHNAGAKKKVSAGLRINPGYSEVPVELYNPAAPGSRLGITREAFEDGLSEIGLEGLDGLHFHLLCEDSAETLERTLAAVYDKFEDVFSAFPSGLRWFNLGGGHHITRDDYNIDLLIELVREAKERTGAVIYLEPGEAIAYRAGVLVAGVLDTGYNELDFAILDTSAACHMPDVLEMPYRPDAFVLFADGSFEATGLPGEKAYTYRLGGPTCLAGDIIGDYSVDRPLRRLDRFVFSDMAIYTIVKNNTFNGMPLPSIYAVKGEDLRLLRVFDYEDFRLRLGSR
jgi:carboxynorspermidine decarboxylase